MPSPLRVAVVARAVMPLHGVGGLERSVHDLVQHLASRGVQIALITPPAWTTTASGFDPARVTLHPTPYVTFPFANRRGTTILDRSTSYLHFGRRAGQAAFDLVERGDVDIVHGFGASVLGYARLRSKVGAPLVLNPQGLEEFGATGAPLPIAKRLGYWPLRRAVRTVARVADAIIATDRSIEPALRRHLNPRPDQIRVIPNGIDLAATDELAGPDDAARVRAGHAVTRDDVVLMSVGRLERNKGFDDLAAALGQLSQPGGALGSRRWRWILVGAGPFASGIEAAVRAHGLGDHVIFAGRLPDAELHAWYEAATLFVHPTRYEGSSLVTLEAMAHRRAVVATRAGGLPDKVRPGVNGWLVDPGDVAALASAVADALAQPDRLITMGAEARTIVTREFAWPVIAEQHIALYRALLEGTAGRRS